MFILIISVIMFVTSVTITPFIVQVQIDRMIAGMNHVFDKFLKQHIERHNEHLQILNDTSALKGMINGSK